MTKLENNRETTKRPIGKRAILALGAIGVASVFMLAPSLEESGSFSQTGPASPRAGEIDRKHVQLSWNMHNETKERSKQIKNLIEANDVDAALLQEVSKDDFEYLAKRMADYYSTFVMADNMSNPRDGGFGNVIITKQKPRDIKTTSMDGPGFLSGIIYTIPGLRQDVAQAKTNFENTKKPWKSDRSSVALTIDVGQGNKTTDLRIINSHIDGDQRVHAKQFSKLTAFIKNQSKKGRPTIFCGDLNSSPDAVIPAMTEIGLITPQTDPTQIPPESKVLDYCSYTTSNILGLAEVNVLRKPHTDHYPLISEWDLLPQD